MELVSVFMVLWYLVKPQNDIFLVAVNQDFKKKNNLWLYISENEQKLTSG